MKINKILGKHGRITIPYEIRKIMGFKYNDVVSFDCQENIVIVRREKICDECKSIDNGDMEKTKNETTLLEVLDGLSAAEQRAALVHLSVKLAQDGDKHA